ncbi:hypothetical protein ZWY2020_020755 [Hordeum vulgare]|nr:hypothetical protein ZWY2020_020755 [Hordeum vulgare]
MLSLDMPGDQSLQLLRRVLPQPEHHDGTSAANVARDLLVGRISWTSISLLRPSPVRSSSRAEPPDASSARSVLRSSSGLTPSFSGFCSGCSSPSLLGSAAAVDITCLRIAAGSSRPRFYCRRGAPWS